MKNEVFSYNGNPVTFQIGTATMVNATEMAKPFGKRPIDWLRLPSTQEFLATLSTIRKSDSEPEVRKSHNGFVVTIKGGNDHTEQGTWMHEDVALEFARWLSPQFAIWCNDRIKELLKHGVTAMPGLLDNALSNPEPLIKALTELKEARERVFAIEEEISRMAGKDTENQSVSITPCVSAKVYTTKELAKELGATAQLLNKILESKGVLERKNGIWTVTAKYAESGYVTVKGYPYKGKSGRERINFWTVWTEKGRRFVMSLFYR